MLITSYSPSPCVFVEYVDQCFIHSTYITNHTKKHGVFGHIPIPLNKSVAMTASDWLNKDRGIYKYFLFFVDL